MMVLPTALLRLRMLMPKKYPTIIKAIHQENGGHGEAVNAGIRNASRPLFQSC